MSTLFRQLFQKQEDVPPELKDLTAQQVAEKIRSLQAQETELTQIKASLSQKDQEHSAVKAEFETVKQQLTALQKTAKPLDSGPKEPTSVLTDEDQAFAERLAPHATATMLANASVAQMRAEQQIRQSSVDARLLDKYRVEVDAMFEAVPLPYRTTPATYIGCFERVIGSKRGELAQLRGTENDPFVESVGGGPAPIPKADKDKLTEQELSVAKKLGVTAEQYLKTKQSAVHVVG